MWGWLFFSFCHAGTVSTKWLPNASTMPTGSRRGLSLSLSRSWSTWVISNQWLGVPSLPLAHLTHVYYSSWICSPGASYTKDCIWAFRLKDGVHPNLGKYERPEISLFPCGAEHQLWFCTPKNKSSRSGGWHSAVVWGPERGDSAICRDQCPGVTAQP